MKINLILAYNNNLDRDWVPSLGLGYISSFLKKNLKNVNISIKNNIKQIIKDKPTIVGISCATQNINIAIHYADLIKKFTNAIVILGGPHITALPNSLPSSFDYGVVGEGEQTFLELIQYIQNKKHKELDIIKGIVYFNKKNIINFTGKRDYIKYLDTLPNPDRKQLCFKNSTVHMMTSRGCPNNCTFCCSNTLWKTTRHFSVEYIIDEIENIISNYHPKIINFFDDIFFRRKEELNDICQKINSKKINQKTSFTCYMRADIVDEEILQLLKNIGVKFIFFGAESGSQKVLTYLKNQSATVQKNQRLLNLALKFNIGIGATFIKGAPIETKDDLLLTYKFIEDNVRLGKLDIWKIFNLSPFPGSVMWEFAKRKKIVDEKMDFSKFAHPEKYLYFNENISKSNYLSICNQYEKKIRNIKIKKRLI